MYGIRFNGVTQGAVFGDDVQAATNFPLVRITNLQVVANGIASEPFFVLVK